MMMARKHKSENAIIYIVTDYSNNHVYSCLMQSAERHLRCLHALGLPPILFEKLPGALSHYFEQVTNNDEKAVDNDDSKGYESSLTLSSGNYGQVILVRPTAALLRQKGLFSKHLGKRGGVYALKRYKAERLDADEQLRIAIPLYLAQQKNEETEENEAKKEKEQNHSRNLVQYVAAYEFQNDGTALLMEWVDGASLAQIAALESQYLYRVVNERRWACWMSDIAQALAHLHKSGVVHRDVHAGNVLIRADDGNASAVLIDLDLACTPNECHYLCTSGPANNQTTAYDLWCRNNVNSATAAQWQAGDVFALGATFLRFAAAKQPLAISTLLPLRTTTRENADGCVPPLDYAIDAAVSRAVRTHIADPTLRKVVQSMLQSDWKKRPSAAQVVELLRSEFHCDRADTRRPFTLPPTVSGVVAQQESAEIADGGSEPASYTE